MDAAGDPPGSLGLLATGRTSISQCRCEERFPVGIPLVINGVLADDLEPRFGDELTDIGIRACVGPSIGRRQEDGFGGHPEELFGVEGGADESGGENLEESASIHALFYSGIPTRKNQKL